jgi:hypothetical protein
MQLDADLIRWVLSGFFISAGTVISWLIGRQVLQITRQVEKQDGRIDSAHNRINELHLDVAQKYVSKSDLKEQLDTQLGPIRNDMRDIKGDIKSLLQRQ